jgi:hypothetical protein
MILIAVTIYVWQRLPYLSLNTQNASDIHTRRPQALVDVAGDREPDEKYTSEFFDWGLADSLRRDSASAAVG